MSQDVGETIWLMDCMASEGAPISSTRAHQVLRRCLFGADAAAHQLRRFAITRALGEGARAVSEAETLARLLSAVERGHLQLRSISTAVLQPTGRVPVAPAMPSELPEPEPVELDDRALMIVRCDPELGPEALAYSYLIRDLPSATLRISSDSFPGTVIHEVALGPEEIAAGVHEAQWDGVVTAAGEDQGRRLRARFGPARLEIIHDDSYRDAASFTIPPLRVHAIDIEDTHFNFDRSIMLADVARVDGSEPVLDARRITGLGVIYAALVHAGHHPEQKILVVGHSDPSGPTSYNQSLSEKRAENVQLFLFGDREGWRTLCDAESHTDDVQAILTWQARRAGWDCDPGPITGSNNAKTRAAIGRFQDRYNLEVEKTADEGLDLPYRAKIGVDDTVGPETWGAFFDVYMHELVRLLEVEGVSEVEAKIAALTQFDSLPKFIGCGEHVPFESGRREPFEDDDERERAQRNPSDRRVELLFFDDVEPPELVCHTGSTCDPTNCPLYTTGEYRHHEIGVPRGLQIGEVVLELSFEDPAGVCHRLPAGLELSVEFDDASTEAHTLGADARLQFVTARDKTSFGFSIAPGEARYLVLAPDEGGAQVSELLDRDAALARVDEGGRMFKLPERFDTRDCEWRVPSELAFEDGQFTKLDDPATQIGTRVAPAQVVLVPRWQHFRFEYFDRWRGAASSIPQPRPRSDETPPLVLEGYLGHGDYEHGPRDPPLAESVWDLEAGAHTVHCVAWVQREVSSAPPAADAPAAPPPEPGDEGPPRAIPDAECLVRFVFPEATFVRTDGAPDQSSATRTIETIAEGHARRDEVTKAGLERLRYYDLPREWWSRGYFARLGSEAAKDRRLFQTITAASAHDDPFVVGLDDLVLCMHATTPNPFDPPRGEPVDHQPTDHYTWEDDDEHRFTLWSAELEAYKPMAGDTYFTDVTKLEPPPSKAVILDHPPFTRMITRGTEVFDVFELRTVRNTLFDAMPIGARVAKAWRDAHESPFYSFDPRYEAPRADETRVASHAVGEIATMVLRCCGQEDGRELFRVAQYAPAWFDFNPASPPRGAAIVPPVPAATALAEIRECLLAVTRRWNGQDGVNGLRTRFEIGPADDPSALGQFHALLVRGVDGPLTHHYRVNIVADARAFMATNCAWERADMKAEADGRFTAAHEWGHAFGNPDHYIEKAKNASLWTDGIRDRWRSPGCPYSFDVKGMMNGEELEPRGYDLWHLLLWMAEAGHSFAGQTELAVRQGLYRYTTSVTPRAQDRARVPVISKVAQPVGASGLCDLFAYAGGVDGFNGGDGLYGASVAAPWDLIVICRVKMAITLSETEHQSYDGGRLFLRTVHRTIKRIFNVERRLLARGTYAGRSVRARILFSPRFISRTYPTGAGTNRTDYLAELRGAPTNAASYASAVTSLISESPVHAEILAVEDPDDHGITNASSNPRRAKLDTDDLEDEIVEIFGRLIGLSDPEDAEASDYAPLVRALAPVFTHSSLEFVE
ncbi:hypothetical protein [Enhygromyxa salina]|uniref:hypothetical protein n=1 Tax=Enhygromyxa salina TaxID=215803 RepID=UPI001C6293DE|nr:hypothetical protein [Enhygromyxa salina]